MLAAVCITPTTHSCANVSTPSPAATGTLARATKRIKSVLIIVGRFLRYSMRGPNGSAMAALARHDNAAKIDTAKAEARSTSTATIGSAPAPIPEPKALTEKAPQSH
jgi:hypothetical protein